MERILKTMQNHIETLRENQKLVLVAIDGRCGSGKSTLAAALAERMPVNVFHMDDFYLRPEQRTEERFREPGGNVNYERFEQEVMMPLQKGTAFSYRPFDCRTFTLAEPIEVVPSVINIIEGSYSCRPTLYSFYDLRIFLTVDQEEQLRRIRKRNGEEKAQMFQKRWIPLEEQYFTQIPVKEHCDMVFDTTGMAFPGQITGGNHG